MAVANLLFSTNGRVGRAGYWGSLVLIVILGLLSALLLRLMFHPVSLILTPGGCFAQFVATMLLLYPAYCVMAKRFQDHNASPSLAMVGVGVAMLKAVLDLLHVTGDPWVPSPLDTAFLVAQVGIGIWYFIVLGCLRGLTGPNHYGHDPV